MGAAATLATTTGTRARPTTPSRRPPANNCTPSLTIRVVTPFPFIRGHEAYVPWNLSFFHASPHFHIECIRSAWHYEINVGGGHNHHLMIVDPPPSAWRTWVFIMSLLHPSMRSHSSSSWQALVPVLEPEAAASAAATTTAQLSLLPGGRPSPPPPPAARRRSNPAAHVERRSRFLTFRLIRSRCGRCPVGRRCRTPDLAARHQRRRFGRLRFDEALLDGGPLRRRPPGVFLCPAPRPIICCERPLGSSLWRQCLQRQRRRSRWREWRSHGRREAPQ